jgi:hypothetical protein
MATEPRAPRSFDVPVCRACKTELPHSRARVIDGGGYLCSDCAYEAEYGATARRRLAKVARHEQLSL